MAMKAFHQRKKSARTSKKFGFLPVPVQALNDEAEATATWRIL